MLFAALHPALVPLPQSLRLLPQSPTLTNFVRIWQLLPFTRYSLNSLFITTLAVPLTIISSSWAGFAIALLPRASQRRWVLLSLALLMVPTIALWMPRFLVYKQLGWLDSPLALLAPAWMGTSPFYILMFYRAFRRIPTALYDAARLDGAGVLQTWARIALPLAPGTTLAVALLSFVFYWGDFISPLLYLSSDKQYTLPVALQLLQQLARADWALLMAAAIVATLIPIIIFALIQLYYARWVEQG
jgi:multiple sugar transport system permease protein